MPSQAIAVSAVVAGRWRRRELSLLGLLLALAALAWAASAGLTTPDMSSGVLTGTDMSRMGGMSAMSSMGRPSAAALGLFVGTWTVMMVAMMFPAMVPVVIAFDRWLQRDHRSRLATSTFVSGYLVVWAGAGIGAYAIVETLDRLFPSHGTSAVRVGAALLIVAGVWQLTPLKYACLRQCQSPLAFLVEHAERLGERGRGPFVVGISHGAYCLGCCWSLMLVLLLLGMMNLAWMALVSVAIFSEKVLPIGRVAAIVIATLLILAGLALLAAPASVVV